MPIKYLSIILSLIFILSLAACKDLPDDSSSGEVNKPTSSIPYSSNSVSSEEPKYKPDLNSWELKLVNKWNTLDEEFEPPLEKISSKYTARTDYFFDSRAIENLYDLLDASKEAGVKLTIISPYRTKSTQTRLFNNQVTRELNNNKNLTREQAEIRAATAVARPRTSEHELGLAVDFNSVEENFEDTKEFKWLKENAHKYGFIMRYPKENQDLTAVIYEPWHYRYVGIENALEIKNSGLCLEEFLSQYK